MQTRIRSLALAALATALFATPGLAKGPPWISIELPVNPYDQSMRGAFLLRSEEHTSELQSRLHLVCRLLLEKKKKCKRIEHTDADRSSNVQARCTRVYD